MSFDPFKKIGEDMKKGFEKMQDDFNQFFNIPRRSETASANITTQTALNNTLRTHSTPAPKTSNVTNQLVEKAIVEKLSSVQDNWIHFMKSAQANTQKMQEQWDANYKKFQGKLKKSSDRVKTQLNQTNTDIQNMFITQQQQIKAFFSKIGQDMQAKNDQNREKVLQSVSGVATGWNQFMNAQQNQLEKTMTQWNKLAFRGQLNFILWLIPVLFVIIIIFLILKPFLPYIPYFLFLF